MVAKWTLCNKRKIITTILFIVLNVLVYKLAILDNNLTKEYKVDNFPSSYLQLGSMKEFKTDAVYSDKQMKLNFITFYLEGIYSKDSDDYISIVIDNAEYKVMLRDCRDGENTINISSSVNVFSGAEAYFMLHSDSESYVNIGVNGSKVALGKTYLVCQLDSNALVFYRGVQIIYWLSVFFMLFVLVWKTQVSKWFYFIGLTVIIFCGINIRDVTFLLNPEPFAEQINTHFWCGVNCSLLQSMTSKEAGYLHFLKRLISWICVRSHFGVTYYVFITNAVALLIESIACSIFIIPDRVLGYSIGRISRYVIIMYIPFLLIDRIPNFFYIDFTYWGILYIIYFLFFCDLNTKNRLQKILINLLLSLFCLSQGQYAILIPVAILYLIFERRDSDKNIIWITLLISSIIQTLATFATSSGESWNNAGQLLSGEKILGMITEIPKVFMGIWGIYISSWGRMEIALGTIIVYILGIGMFIYSCYEWKHGKTQWSLTMISIELFIISSVFFMAITSGAYILDIGYYDRGRYEMFLILGVYLFVFLTIYKVFNRYRVLSKMDMVYLIIFNLLVAFWVKPIYMQNAIYVMDSVSDWKNTVSYIEKNESFIIFLNPDNWTWTQYYKNITMNNIHSEEEMVYIDCSAPVVCVYTKRSDVSCILGLRVYDSEKNILAEFNQTTNPIKVNTAFYFDSYIENAAYIQFFDSNTGETKVIDEDILVIFVGNESYYPYPEKLDYPLINL